MGKQEKSPNFLQVVTQLRELIQPYMPSYKVASVYILKIRGQICQLCIVLEPFEPTEEYTELYSEPTTDVKLFVRHTGVEEVFQMLQHYAMSGSFTLADASEPLAYSADSLTNVQLLDRERIHMFGRDWSCWGMNSYCSKSLDKIYPTFDFNKLYKLLREERDYSNLQELMKALTGLPHFIADSNIAPGIVILCPIWARLNRCGVTNDNVRIYMQTLEELSRNDQLHINILCYTKDSQPSLLKVSINKMKGLSGGENSWCHLVYELPVGKIDRIEVELKDHAGLARSSCTENITWAKELQIKSKEFRRMQIALTFRKVKDLLVLPLALIGLVVLGVYSAWFYGETKALPDPVALTTIAMAIATVLMAYMAKRGLDQTRIEHMEVIAEEAANEFLATLRQEAVSIIDHVDLDEPVTIFPDWLQPKPHLAPLTYAEAPNLLGKVSGLLRAAHTYNTSIERKDAVRLRGEAQKLIRSIDNLVSDLSRKYLIKVSERKVSAF